MPARCRLPLLLVCACAPLLTVLFDAYPAEVATLHSATPNVALPEKGTATSSITVPAVRFTSIRLSLRFAHSFVADAAATLTAPDGTMATVFNNAAPCVGAKQFDLVFDPHASRPLSAACFTDPWQAHVQPQSSFDAIPLTQPRGDWTLTVVDDQPVHGGTLEHWSLELVDATAPQYSAVGIAMLASTSIAFASAFWCVLRAAQGARAAASSPSSNKADEARFQSGPMSDAEKKLHEEAIQRCSVDALLRPTDAAPLVERAWARLALGEFAGCAADCTAALECDPGCHGARLLRGTAGLLTRHWSAAEQDFERLEHAELPDGQRDYLGRQWAEMARCYEQYQPHDSQQDHRAVLGLDAAASPQAIKERYYLLAKRWHPEKHQLPGKKSYMQRRFQEINAAYEALLQM